MRAPPQVIHYTPKSVHEADIIRAYCEAKFPVGEPTDRYHAITGERYIQFSNAGYSTLEAVRLAAQDRFDEYARDKTGTLYWRIPPEIAFNSRRQDYAYYMRLLISNKPRLSQ
jgi:hypothetical protein